MAKSRFIPVSQELEAALKITESRINERRQELIDRRANSSPEDMFNEVHIAQDHLDLFTKEELVALLLHVTSQAGFLEYKMMELQKKANIPLELFNSVLHSGILPSEDEIRAVYRDEPDKEDEDFI